MKRRPTILINDAPRNDSDVGGVKDGAVSSSEDEASASPLFKNFMKVKRGGGRSALWDRTA